MKWKPFSLKLILLLGSTALCITALELILLIDDWRPEVAYTTRQLGSSSYVFLDQPSGFDDLREGVVFVGDSFTVGEACGLDANYPSAFREAARRHGSPLKILNLGISGAGPFTYLSVIKDLLAEGGRPSTVIVTLIDNDLEPKCPLCSHLEDIQRSVMFSDLELDQLVSFCARCRERGGGFRASYDPLRRIHTLLRFRSYSYRAAREPVTRVADLLGLEIGFVRSSFPIWWQDHSSRQYRLLKLALMSMKARLDEAQVKMVVVIYPNVVEMTPDNPYVELYEVAARDLEESLGGPVHSGYGAFLGNAQASDNMRFSLSDAHPNCDAHAIFGSWVFNRYLDDAGRDGPKSKQTPPASG